MLTSSSICFIHGLNGGSISTWTKGDIFWPFNLLAHDIPDARVISWGYNAAAAHFLSPTSTCSVKDHAGSLLNDLRGHRNTQETSKRPIILIAHSLGGLVCAKVSPVCRFRALATFANFKSQSLLLSRSIETASVGRLCDNAYALMFMGTPFEGSGTTKWVDFFEKFAKIIPATNINKMLTDHLKPDSHDLKALTEEFPEWLTSLERQARGGIQVMCFFEEFPSRPGGQIVPRESAKLSGHHVVSISADHTGICKFDNFKDPKYKAVVHHLQKWVDEIKAANTAAKPKTVGFRLDLSFCRRRG